MRKVTVEDRDWLAGRFEAHRGHLRAVAYRLLGSASEADDAVQEAWLRLARAGAGDADNLGGWLTTVVARVCLDMAASRGGDFEALVALLDPDVVLRADPERLRQLDVVILDD